MEIRYFDDQKNKCTIRLELIEGMKIDQINKYFESDLREINYDEYEKLSKEYQGY